MGKKHIELDAEGYAGLRRKEKGTSHRWLSSRKIMYKVRKGSLKLCSFWI